MKDWPRVTMPKNFHFTPEQRLRLQGLPRDTGHIPRNFVLRMVYYHQPVPVEKLWDICTSESGCVLDSKKHLRDVLKCCRDESFVHFEKQGGAGAGWLCHLTRERLEDVKRIVATTSAEEATPAALGMRGTAATQTSESIAAVQDRVRVSGKEAAAAANAEGGDGGPSSSPSAENVPASRDEEEVSAAAAALSLDDGESRSSHDAELRATLDANTVAARHIEFLRQALSQSQDISRRFRRSEVDYLPYTDLNGKVKMMWWYDVQEGPERASVSLGASSSGDSSAKLGDGGSKPGGGVAALT